MSYLVADPEDRFSHNMAQMNCMHSFQDDDTRLPINIYFYLFTLMSLFFIQPDA